MMRNVRVEDITADEIPLQRELRAATIMRALLCIVGTRLAIADARQEDIPIFCTLCEYCGVDRAWAIALQAGMVDLLPCVLSNLIYLTFIIIIQAGMFMHMRWWFT